MKKHFLFFILISLSSSLLSLENFNKVNYKEVKCKLVPILRLRENNFDNLLYRKTRPHISNPFTSLKAVSSSNWAGYVAGKTLINANTDANTVSYVRGVWQVPTIAPSNTATYCAIWIGVDGFNDGTVEQIGTEHEYYSNGQHNYAWVEMYPKASQYIRGFRVDVGDVIESSMEYTNNGFTFYLINHTKNEKTRIRRKQKRALQRSSAEWIVEAPYSNKILPLGNFGTIALSGCQTKINNVLGNIHNPNWANLAITMEANNIVKAQTNALDSTGQNFSVDWKSN